MIMSHKELQSPDLNARITNSIETGIAAETARRELTEQMTIREAESCLIAVCDQVLAILAKRRSESYAYDEEAILREMITRNIMDSLIQTLTTLVTEDELSRGASLDDAEATAHALIEKIFIDYDKKRMSIGNAQT